MSKVVYVVTCGMYVGVGQIILLMLNGPYPSHMHQPRRLGPRITVNTVNQASMASHRQECEGWSPVISYLRSESMRFQGPNR